MILKKLEIQGFKSFADRVEVLFSPGVIAVVGPNGSGKSNISDAILWVLGEQNVRALRGEKSRDVIFAGTDKRRAVGMAEVSLTVDNTSGRLPVNYTEVTVTRRAYRSGESEFFINKTPCRLKDIYELFLDTGVGREAYSIVSQGEIDAILSVRSEDRRALFDEAAGIRKYRVRKKEAERKLESTEQNLNRVNDIVTEIQCQIEPMREQAETATRYLELAERLQEIEVGILVTDLQRFTGDIARVRDERASGVKSIADSDAVLSALDEEKSALAADLSAADAQVERFHSLYQEALSHQERTESRLALVNQRHTASINAEKLLVEEIAQIEGRIAQLEAQRTDVSAEKEGAGEEELRLSELMAAKTVALEDIQAKLDAESKAVEDQKASYIELAKQLAAQRNELTNTAARIENLRLLLDRRSADLQTAERASARAKTEFNGVEKEFERIKTELASVSENMARLRSELEEKRASAKQAGEQIVIHGRDLADKGSRLHTLREMEEAREGYFAGVRSVMSALKGGKIHGGYKVVADVIKVPKGYETAFEVALGASVQDIITDTEREAKDGIEYLKRNHAGRATFLPLNMMRHSVSPALKDLVGKNGVLGIGNALLEFDKKYSPAIDSLLAKVLVAEDIDAAIAASRSAIGWNRIVTLDGELISPSGAMTGGHAVGKVANLLSRKQEMESLKTEVQGLEAGIASWEKSLATLQKDGDDLAARLRVVEEQDTKLKMGMLEKERQIEYVGKESKRLTNEQESLEAEKEDIQEQLKKARETHAVLTETVASADKQNTTLDGTMSQSAEEIRGLQDQYDALSAEVNQTNVTLASLTQKRLGIEQMLETSETSKRELAAEIYRKRDQLKNAVQEKADTDTGRGDLETELEKCRETSGETHTQAEQWRKTKQEIIGSSTEVNDRIKDVSRGREEVQQKVHASELRETRLDVQITQTTARLLEEYDIAPEEALRREPPDEKQGSAAEVFRLRREIKSMGEVNTGAVQEYSRLTERYDFLNSQRQDLFEARQKLLDAIKEIDESTRGVFMETFEAVRVAFQDMFKRLFDGGSTDLILSNPEDILETGIDVIVEMPGKKRQNLMLLSGGERALTAAALMFALMVVRPSPFCLLDEVDAPLDEANVERFAEVVKDFALTSQMIVITHNKATMEAADILYGVTMQEPGISKLVSVKLSEALQSN